MDKHIRELSGAKTTSSSQGGQRGNAGDCISSQSSRKELMERSINYLFSLTLPWQGDFWCIHSHLGSNSLLSKILEQITKRLMLPRGGLTLARGGRPGARPRGLQGTEHKKGEEQPPSPPRRPNTPSAAVRALSQAAPRGLAGCGPAQAPRGGLEAAC